MKQFLEIGKIVSTHGVRGEVRVQPWCDAPSVLCGMRTLYFDDAGQTPREVRAAGAHKGMALVHFAGVDTMEAANALRGQVLYAPRAAFRLPERTYFIQDLVGLDVRDADTDVSYGQIAEVSQTGANDVYHIRGTDGRVTLIPAIREVVVETDVEGGVMKIRPLRGLFDAD